jgi:hypothetical protein
MVHDARVVRMNAEHLPSTIRKWMGDSVGRWDGDTLVVDTTNFTDKTRFRGSSEQLHVVERFSRLDANTLRYRFTVEDPSTWERLWSGEEVWPATKDLLFEYACHEGNYAMGNILRGARLKEKTTESKNVNRRDRRTRREHFLSAFSALFAVRFHPENPTQRPLAPTPNHSSSDTTPTSLSTMGGVRPSPVSVTFRRTLTANSVPNSRHVIFQKNGVL